MKMGGAVVSAVPLKPMNNFFLYYYWDRKKKERRRRVCCCPDDIWINGMKSALSWVSHELRNGRTTTTTREWNNELLQTRTNHLSGLGSRIALDAPHRKASLHICNSCLSSFFLPPRHPTTPFALNQACIAKRSIDSNTYIVKWNCHQVWVKIRRKCHQLLAL